MKRSFAKSVKFFSAAVVMAFMVMAAPSISNAQVSGEDVMGTKNVTISKKAVANLLENLKSENPGVRKSSIFYAGYYRVKEAVEPLMEQLKKEDDPSIRVLISLSLYKMDDEKAMGAVKYFAENDSNPRVKRMCKAIYNEFLLTHDNYAVK